MPGPDGRRGDAAGRESAFPGAGMALLLMLALFLCEVLVYSVLRRSGVTDGSRAMEAGVLATVLGNGIVLATWLSAKRLTYAEVIHPARASATATLCLVVVPLLLVLPATYLVEGTVQELLVMLVPMSERQLKMFADMVTGGPAVIVGVVLVAPVVEELFYRGIVLRGLLHRYSRRNALLMSSVLFGAAHLNLYQFVSAGLAGLLLGWLYIHFRSTLPGIFFHAVYNGAFVLTAMVGPEQETSFFEVVPGYLWFAALPLLFAGALALSRLAARARAAAPA